MADLVSIQGIVGSTPASIFNQSLFAESLFNQSQSRRTAEASSLAEVLSINDQDPDLDVSGDDDSDDQDTSDAVDALADVSSQSPYTTYDQDAASVRTSDQVYGAMLDLFDTETDRPNGNS
jgi:hypothetical protein